MNEMDTRQGKGDIAGNTAVGAIPLALCQPFHLVLLLHLSRPWITWGPSAAIPPSKRATSGQFGQSLNAAKRLLESLGIKKTVIKANRVSRLGGRDLSWFLLLER
jgi:hypothetical protein